MSLSSYSREERDALYRQYDRDEFTDTKPLTIQRQPESPGWATVILKRNEEN